ncbi:ubiquitin hydrolase [Histomonas meleagridis]|uniref:ubiquitin hydrolase n=1 Tax=Histomonas meleagridis TaxID=135588 RepID=UPI00355A4997|nr:ubiquitin hydrolase [Histomonas meleagridis]KAH0804135.1 ubiquitin hydrolase [Histomonas meleagridis]
MEESKIENQPSEQPSTIALFQEEEEEEELFYSDFDENYYGNLFDEDSANESESYYSNMKAPEKQIEFCDYDINIELTELAKLTEESTNVIEVGLYTIGNYTFQLKLGKIESKGPLIFASVTSQDNVDVDISLKIEPLRKFISNHSASFSKTINSVLLRPHLFSPEEIPTENVSAVLSFHFTPDVLLTKDYFNCVGLRNSGMTCYLNSLIQCLFHLKPFRNIVFSIDNPKSEIANNLKLTFARMQMMSHPVSTRQLTKSFGWEIEDLFTQQDVQELMKLLLDRLDDSCHNKTSELFKGVMKSYIRCPSANYESSHDEDFCDLSLQVEGLKCLEDSLTQYFQPDKLTGDDQYELPDGSKADAEVGSELKENPQILCLHLRRFRFGNNNLTKINSTFSFPDSLTFGGDRYQLHSIISHFGSVFGGHYNAFVKIDGIWTNFDDENVRHVESHEAIEENFGEEGQRSFTAYVLFYIKPEFDEMEEPEIPIDIIESEARRASEITIVLQTSIGKLDKLSPRSIRVNKDLNSEEFKEFISHETQIPIDQLVIRKVTDHGYVKEIIPDPVPIPQFFYHADYTTDLPIFVTFFIPGYELIPLGFIHIQPGETIEQLSNKIFEKLKLEPLETIAYYDFGQDEIGSIATGPINECQQFIFELKSQENSQELIEPIKRTFNEKIEKINPPKEKSHFTLLDNIKVDTLKDFFSYVKNNRIMTFKSFDNTGQEFKLELACNLTFKQVLECIGKYLNVDPNKIFLFLPDKWNEGPSFHYLLSDIFPNFRTLSDQTDLLYYEVSEYDTRFYSRIYVTIINNYKTEKSFPLYFLKKFKVNELKEEIARQYETDDFILFYISDGIPYLIPNDDDEVNVQHKIGIQFGVGEFDNEKNMLLRVIYYDETFQRISSNPEIPFLLNVNIDITWKELKGLELFKDKKLIVLRREKRNSFIEINLDDNNKIDQNDLVAITFKKSFVCSGIFSSKQMTIKKEDLDSDEDDKDFVGEEEEEEMFEEEDEGVE